MSEFQTAWPQKKREYVDALMDSRIWNDFRYRPGDIVIATWSKAGTTWVQQILAQLIFGGHEVVVGELSPWLEFTLAPKEQVFAGLEQQTNRRFIKTHLPIEALSFDPGAKYIYIARDGRDVAFSYHHFHSLLPALPGIDPPNPDLRQYFNDWLDKDGYPYHPFFSHIQGWWNVGKLPNVLLVHFSNLKADMSREIRRIAAFVHIEIDASRWPLILEHCGFEYMKRNAETVAPHGAAHLKGGKTQFFRSGASGGWRNVLTGADSAKYEAFVDRMLTPDCAQWLRTGELHE
jgi:aryl sulfotransferase